MTLAKHWARNRGALALLLLVCTAHRAEAQRSSEDAVAEAEDAFGTTVGRESIGLYSPNSARGFSPVQAGNLRIDGLYFDQISGMANLVTRIVRSEAVHVGIAAQGYLFPAPTGVVDYQLRTPGNESLVSALIGTASDGVAYEETDAQIALRPDVFGMGFGIGLARNNGFDYGAHGTEFDAGWIARWRPSSALVITPFWGLKNVKQSGNRLDVFIGDSGYPSYRSVYLPSVPWARFGYLTQNFGATARYEFGDGWRLATGLFRSLSYSPGNDDPELNNVNGLGQGVFALAGSPPNSSGSTSGEIRLSKRFDTGPIHNAAYVHITGRDSSIESGGNETANLVAATTTYLPPLPRPPLDVGPNTDVRVQQFTPGVAYSASWPDRAQMTLGLQKIDYRRTVTTPGFAVESDRDTPWVYNAAGGASLTHALLFYASYTRGFEEAGIAPSDATNRFEPLPAELDRQVDAGLRYQLQPRLQLVAGVFEINKPYFDFDQTNLFRLVGNTTNRGAEISLTGDLTSRLNVVSGFVLIHPTVQFQPGTVPGPPTQIAIGPIPGYMSTYLQYHPAAVPGLIIGATIQTTSSRYAVYPNIDLPAATTFGADIRYHTQLWGKNATFWLESYNLDDAYVLRPNESGQLNSLDARRFELSLVVDI
jgi:iron complex outermembrane recepter protein